MNIDYPYHFDGRGRTATTDDDAHIRDLIEVEAVEVSSEDATLRVTVQYRVRRNNERQTAEFTRAGGL